MGITKKPTIGVPLPDGTFTVPNRVEDTDLGDYVKHAYIALSLMLSYWCVIDGLTVMIFRFTWYTFIGGLLKM